MSEAKLISAIQEFGKRSVLLLSPPAVPESTTSVVYSCAPECTLYDRCASKTQEPVQAAATLISGSNRTYSPFTECSTRENIPLGANETVLSASLTQSGSDMNVVFSRSARPT